MRKKLIGLVALIMVLISSGTHAGDPVALSVSGKVVAAPCQVDSESINRTVDLFGAQGMRYSSFYTPGSGSPFVAFDFRVVNCPAGTMKATLLFNGPADDNQPEDSYKNSGTANNIAVQLINKQGAPLGNNKTMTEDIVDSQARFSLLARAYSKYGKVTPGTISTAVVVTITWQ